MLRINLLPAYLGEKRKVRTAIVLVSVVLIAIIAAGLGYNFGPLQTQVKDEDAKATAREADAQAERDIESKTASIRSAIAPLGEKVALVEAVRYHNKLYQKIYRQAAAYTYKEIELNSMSISGSTLSMTAYAKQIDDIGRFYIYMFGNPDVTAVSISGVPSYQEMLRQTPVSYPGGPPPIPPAYKVNLNANLVKPVAAPQLPASLNPGGTNGGPGGPPPGAPGAEMPPGA